MKTLDIVNQFNRRAYSKPWHPTSLSRQRIAKILDLSGTQNRILDIGCYDGTIARSLKKMGNEVVGIDISPKAVQMTKSKGISAYVCDIEKQPLPKSLGKFDLVIAGELIEHIFDTDSFFKKMHSVIKPGGHLLLTTPNLAGLGSRISLLLGQKPWMIENSLLGEKAGHIRYFTFSELSRQLENWGFKSVKNVTDSVGLQANLNFPFLDKWFPSLGRTIIIKAERN